MNFNRLISDHSWPNALTTELERYETSTQYVLACEIRIKFNKLIYEKCDSSLTNVRVLVTTEAYIYFHSDGHELEL